MSLVFVAATRMTRDAFLSSSLLARSLNTLSMMSSVKLCLFEQNSRPLGECYNQAIDEADPQDTLVFAHDDVHLDDWMLPIRLEQALASFDVVGVAGNRRRQHGQETWYLLPSRCVAGQRQMLTFDSQYLSGAILHGQPGQAKVSNYGPTPATVQLLDGVFMAMRAGRLQGARVRFDPSLGFHFYDLDFCRTAQAAGLRLGTWPIAITHASEGGSIHSQAWADSCERYLAKYGEQRVPC